MEYTLVRSQHNCLANHVTERSCRRSSSSICFPMCIIVDIKKAEPFETYLQSEEPPSTFASRQARTVHAQNEREPSSAYSHLLQIGGFQTKRIRAKSSNIF